jgi:hypothetical protein
VAPTGTGTGTYPSMALATSVSMLRLFYNEKIT